MSPPAAFGPLVDTASLAARLGDAAVRVVDVRWRLGEPGAGRRAWERERIPGARFLDVDDDLADRSDLRRGRHPLPSPERFVAALASIGVGRGTQVIAYDDAGGAAAARLWWMVRALGGAAAVLDGGWPRWVAEGRAIERGTPSPIAPSFEPFAAPRAWPGIVSRDEVRAIAEGRRDALLLDARAPERYRGEVEPVDRRAGHIPGAANAPFADNLDGGRFRAPEELRDRFRALGAGGSREVVCYCGSGVTACHDLLALAVAGLDGAKLYPGSWSEWVADER